MSQDNIQKKLIVYCKGMAMLESIPNNVSLLIYTRSGLVKFLVKDISYIITKNSALWIPHGKKDILSWSISGQMDIFAFMSVCSIDSLNNQYMIASVDNLSRELLNFIVDAGGLSQFIPGHESIFHLLTLFLNRPKPSTNGIPMPKDERGKKLFNNIIQTDGLNKNLNDLAKSSGASKRTIERIIQNDLGMSFSQWRQIIRVHVSLEYLVEGSSVTDAALSVGYGSSSAYITIFKKHFGISPNQFRNSHRIK